MDTRDNKDGPKAAKVEDQKPLEDDVGDVPDPDEDDLDDLDDMLDDFASVKVNSKAPEAAPAPSKPAEPAAAPPAAPKSDGEDVLSDDDFAKQLQAGMAELMGEVESSPELQAQFESIFKELGGGAGAADPAPSTAGGSSAKPPGAAPPAAPPSGAAASDASFQETIRRTMERMQASGEQATAAATAEGSDDFLAELMKQMQAAGGPDGEGSDEEFSKVLLGMMEQLTNRDILYEPMKELNDKFPDWLDKNRDKTSREDLERYEEQQRYAREIVGKFEEPTYSDSNAADREYIVDRMQKMQAAGSPPSDLVGDMPSAQEALNAPDAESCAPQ